MKTLVTGATGFLGRHLMTELCARGDARKLRVLDIQEPKWLTELGVEIVIGSVTSQQDVERAIKGCDRIYHLAGMVSRRTEDMHRMYNVHVDGTRILCTEAVKAGVVRIVLSSSSGTVAVARRADEMPDEMSPAPLDIISRWPYYASKLYQEEAARKACGDAVELVTVNPSLLLGPGDDRLGSTKDVLSFLSGDIPLIPPGGLNFVDARDVAAALPAAMERGRAGDRYLLGGWNWTFEEYFGRLERLTKINGPRLKAPNKVSLLAAKALAAVAKHRGRTPTIEPASVEMAQYFWYFESHKAIAELGFTAREATATLFDTVAYLQQNFLGGRGTKA